jgi:hypothetical protein
VGALTNLATNTIDPSPFRGRLSGGAHKSRHKHNRSLPLQGEARWGRSFGPPPKITPQPQTASSTHRVTPGYDPGPMSPSRPKHRVCNTRPRMDPGLRRDDTEYVDATASRPPPSGEGWEGETTPTNPRTPTVSFRRMVSLSNHGTHVRISPQAPAYQSPTVSPRAHPEITP